MNESPYNSNDSKSRLAASGYRLLSQRFNDRAMEKEFWDLYDNQNADFWGSSAKAFTFAGVVFLGLYLTIRPSPQWNHLVLFALFIGLNIYGMALNWRRRMRRASKKQHFFLIFSVQAIAVAAVAVSESILALSPMAYLAILVGGMTFNRLIVQMLMTLVPTFLFVAILLTAKDPTRHHYYHFAFSAAAASIALVSGVLRARAARIEFLLSRELAAALKNSERLLFNVLPAKIAHQMRDFKGEEMTFVEHFDDATVLFADIVGFTAYAATHSAEDTIGLLSNVFRRFDAIVEQCGVEKIKTMGDAYMAVSGLPEKTDNHLDRMADAALEMREAIQKVRFLTGVELEVRIGIHRGPVIAGIIGTKKFLYDLWGDTVNMAARLESHGIPGQIQISKEVAASLNGRYIIKSRGTIDLRGRGSVEAYILERPIIVEAHINDAA